jgi:hypothetical protein
MAAAAAVADSLLLTVGCSSPSSSTGSTSSNTSSATSWATASSVSAGGGMTALVAAAKKEGQLNVITLPSNWANYGTIMKDSTAKYGIKINDANPDGSSQDELNAVNQVAENHERGAEQHPGREHAPVVRTDHEPHDVRHDQADEPDDTADRDRDPGHQRGDKEQVPSQPPDIDAQRRGRLGAHRERVQRAGLGHQVDHGGRQRRRRDRQLVPAGQPERPEQPEQHRLR